MSALTDALATAKAAMAKVSDDLDSIKAQIKALNDKIIAFNNSPGPLSPEDQKSVDGIVTDSAALAAKADAIAVPPLPPVPPVA